MKLYIKILMLLIIAWCALLILVTQDRNAKEKEREIAETGPQYVVVYDGVSCYSVRGSSVIVGECFATFAEAEVLRKDLVDFVVREEEKRNRQWVVVEGEQ